MIRHPLKHLVLLGLALGLVLTGAACADAGRVGFAEEFDTVEGWKPVDDDHAPAGMSAADGTATFRTFVGSFMGAKPPDQARAYRATSQIYKDYGREVDLDRYHYVVMKIDEKSMYSILEINRKQVQAAYTTGVVAQDLRPLGLTGKHKLRLDLEMMNNGRELKADYVRLVSELTAEERKGLVPPPVRLYKEGVAGHPYQRLEALNARSARIWRTGAEEKAVFRDVGTGAVTWRMTADPGDEGFSERFDMWTPDGSAFCVWKTPSRVYTFETDTFAPGRMDKYRPPQYNVNAYAGPDRKEVHVLRRDDKTGQYEVIFRRAKSSSGGIGPVIRGDKIAILITGQKLLVMDGSAADPAKTIKEFPVPKLSAKGRGLSSDGKWFGYFSPFGCYLKTLIDTETGELRKGSQFTFTHGMGGRPWSIMSYGGNAKLQVSEAASYGGNSRPGEALRVHGVYLDPVSTDYGAMTSDGRYGYTNGLKGELAAQHVMFDREDAGTILRLCTYRVSKINWDVWTKTIASPDYTKLMYCSDMLGTGDYYMAIIRRPDPPRAPKAERTDRGVRLSWQPPVRHAEVKGYVVYRAAASGRGFSRITDELVEATSFVDSSAPAGKAARYLVAAREHSGLEGTFSDEVGVGPTGGPVRLHVEAEAGRPARPMREIFDGRASGYKGMRVTQVADGEDRGELVLATRVPAQRKYAVWARCRGKGTLHVRRSDDETDSRKPALKVDSAAWRWGRFDGKLDLTPKHGDVTLASRDDGLAVDKIVVTDDDAYTPKGADDRTAPPAGVTDLKVAETTVNSISLAWRAPDGVDVHYYSVYVGDKADFACGNETLLCSTRRTTAVDWDIPAGRTYHYKVVAVDRRGNASTPAAVEATTKPLKLFLAELPVAQARAGEGLLRAKDVDVDYVAGAKAGSGDVAFDLDVPAEGTYYLWAEYGARFGRPTGFAVKLDDRDGQWRTRQPTRMGRDLRGATARWFVDRVSAVKRRRPAGLGKLTAGKHTLTFTLDARTPLLSKVWVTNDPSHVPPGYSAQCRFNRDRRQK